MGDETRVGCALVTGASRGIGAETARLLAAAGWAVAVNYRSDSVAAEAVVADIVEHGGSALAVQGDVSATDGIDPLFAAVEERLGPVLVLVNNAGIRADGLSVHLEDEDWARVLDTNLSGVFRVTRRALTPMLQARWGRVINVVSVAGMRASSGQANYVASKAGVIGLTKTIALEVARRGITINAVAPGYVPTDFNADVVQDLVAKVPMGRAGTAHEVAACVRFLASSDASYVTGSTFVVDGGMSA